MKHYKCTHILLLITILTSGCATSTVWERNTHGTFKNIQSNKATANQIYYQPMDHFNEYRKKRFNYYEKRIYIPFKVSEDRNLFKKKSFPPSTTGVLEIKTGEHFDRILNLLSDKHSDKIELFYLNIRKIHQLHNETRVMCYMGAYLKKDLKTLELKSLESDQIFISDQSTIPQYKLRDAFNDDFPLTFLMRERAYLPVYIADISKFDLSENKYSLLIKKPFDFDILFTEENETREYVSSVVGRILLTPFAIAFDVVTSPIQIVIGIFLYNMIPDV